MLNEKTDFFKIENNFKKNSSFPSIPIIESSFDFIPVYTIAIPTYKRTDKLIEAVTSAINQKDYYAYDILIVDNNPVRDCSTEKWVTSIDNPKVSYFKNSSNLLMTGNLNRCFELAKGAYVVLLHDDDLLLPTFLVECNRIIQKKRKVGILKPAAYAWREEMGSFNLHQINTSKYYKLQRIYDFSNFNRFIIGAPTGCVFNKNDFIELGGYNHDYFPMMDFSFAIIFSQKKQVYYYTKVLSIYRISINESLNLQTLKVSFKGVFLITKQILRRYKIPESLANKYMECKLTLSKRGYISFNKGFEYDIREFGLKEPKQTQIIIYKIVVRLVNIFIQYFTNVRM
jgi:glycosyltransferase involved in cell wall biosynthesis